MIRLTLFLVVWMSTSSTASASLLQHRDSFPFGTVMVHSDGSRPSLQALERAVRPGAMTEYVLTAQTEVTLDDKPCKYASVPGNARIVKMEVAADQKTVLRIHFRTRK